MEMQRSFSNLLFKSFTWRIAYYASAFVLNLCIARYYGAANSGEFNYIISILSLATLVCSFSLDSAIGYHYLKGNINPGIIAGFLLIWLFFIAAISLLLKLIFPSLNSIYFSVLSILFVAGSLLTTVLQAVYYATYNYKLPAAINSTINLLLAVFLSFASVSIEFFFQAYCIAILLQGLLFLLLFLLKEKTYPHFRFTFKQIGFLFPYAVIAFTGNLIFFLVYRVDYWFVNRFCDEELLGNYVQVSKLAQLFLIIPAGIAAVIFPATAKGDFNISRNIQLLSRLLLNFFLIIIIVLIATGQWLFPLLFGIGFSAMYGSFLLITPGILALIILSLLGAYFAGKGLVRVNVSGAAIGLVVIILFDMLLIPSWNIKGAALASTIGYASYLAYSLYHFSRNEVVKISKMFIIQRTDINMLKVIISGKQRTSNEE